MFAINGRSLSVKTVSILFIYEQRTIVLNEAHDAPNFIQRNDCSWQISVINLPRCRERVMYDVKSALDIQNPRTYRCGQFHLLLSGRTCYVSLVETSIFLTCPPYPRNVRSTNVMHRYRHLLLLTSISKHGNCIVNYRKNPQIV